MSGRASLQHPLQGVAPQLVAGVFLTANSGYIDNRRVWRKRPEESAVSGFDQDQLKQIWVEVSWQERGRQHKLRRGLRVCGLEDR